MLPVTNVLPSNWRSGRISSRIIRALPEVVSAELRDGLLRVGVKDLTTGAPAILDGSPENGHAVSTRHPMGSAPPPNLELFFSHPDRKEPARLMIPFMASFEKICAVLQ